LFDICCLYILIIKYQCVSRSGHILTFLKLFHSVLERGPSARSFRSCFFFFLVLFCPIPFLVEDQSSHFVLFLAFLVKEQFHPSCSILSQIHFHPKERFYAFVLFQDHSRSFHSFLWKNKWNENAEKRENFLSHFAKFSFFFQNSLIEKISRNIFLQNCEMQIFCEIFSRN